MLVLDIRISEGNRYISRRKYYWKIISNFLTYYISLIDSQQYIFWFPSVMKLLCACNAYAVTPIMHNFICSIIFYVRGKRRNMHKAFMLKGLFFLSSCIHEYMDIYSEIRSENTTKLIETPFGGRFCGPIPPRRRVSLYQGIALSFYTDKNITLPNVFSGIYRFINACESCSVFPAYP